MSNPNHNGVLETILVIVLLCLAVPSLWIAVAVLSPEFSGHKSPDFAGANGRAIVNAPREGVRSR